MSLCIHDKGETIRRKLFGPSLFTHSRQRCTFEAETQEQQFEQMFNFDGDKPQKKQNGVKWWRSCRHVMAVTLTSCQCERPNLASVPICYLLWFCLFGKVQWKGARTWAFQLFLLMHKATTTASLVVNSVIFTVGYSVCKIEMQNQFRKVLLCILREWTVEFSLVCLNFWRGASLRQSTVYRANIKSLSK